MGELRVRFLVHKVNKRILYMEAGKEVVDLLLAFLQLPLAAILSMFNPAEKAGSALKLGSLSNIYESLQKISEASLMVSKASIIKPSCASKLSKNCEEILRQPQRRSSVPTFSASCGPSEDQAPAGYVKDYLTFIVTDDLCILPASTIESIVLLNKLNVEKMSDLDSLECSLTADEALELLKVSFTSTKALNHVFGHKVASSSFETASVSAEECAI